MLHIYAFFVSLGVFVPKIQQHLLNFCWWNFNPKISTTSVKLYYPTMVADKERIDSCRSFWTTAWDMLYEIGCDKSCIPSWAFGESWCKGLSSKQDMVPHPRILCQRFVSTEAMHQECCHLGCLAWALSVEPIVAIFFLECPLFFGNRLLHSEVGR